MKHALLLLPLLWACGDHDDDSAEDSTVTDDSGTDDSGTDDSGASSSIPDNLSACDATAGDAVDVNAVSINGDTLTVSVAYSGGCADHDFALCWPDQSFMESEPVQAQLYVWHDGNGDACEAYPSEDVDFDLSDLRDNWRSAYQSQSGTITVHVNSQTASYSF